MELRVVDFDVLTRNYKNYQDGIRNLSEVRNSFITKLNPLKNEMEKIIKEANSNDIIMIVPSRWIEDNDLLNLISKRQF